MVAAAFIGPGTVVTATKAGGSFGYTLLWAVVFSTIACLILQEMAARLGVAGRMGLGEAIREKIPNQVLRGIAIILVIGAILIGNAAYEAGNITGASVGASVIFPSFTTMAVNPVVVVVSLIAFGLLLSGMFRLIEGVLIGLVCLMGLVFVWIAIDSQPPIGRVIQGLLTPRIPDNDNGLMTVLGLIGTTVVPYNLFLHASSAKNRWANASDITDARLDTILSVSFGGLITAVIMIAAASTFEQVIPTIEPGTDFKIGIQEFTVGLAQLYGPAAAYVFAFGMFAAGLSSAITAPLAAAYAASEIFGWARTPEPTLGNQQTKSTGFRLIWIIVLVMGGVSACAGFKPEQLILLAQVANGLLLPVIASFLVWIMNARSIMGENRNGIMQNVLGVFVVLVAFGLGGRLLWSAYLKCFPAETIQAAAMWLVG